MARSEADAAEAVVPQLDRLGIAVLRVSCEAALKKMEKAAAHAVDRKVGICEVFTPRASTLTLRLPRTLTASSRIWGTS